jgi:hypothetical protein
VLARNYHLILSRIHAIIDCEAELPDVHGSLAERSYPVADCRCEPEVSPQVYWMGSVAVQGRSYYSFNWY